MQIDPLIRQLQEVVGYKVDLTLLSKGEERNAKFVEREGCQELERFISKLVSQNPERPE
jgi:hypothetical protein